MLTASVRWQQTPDAASFTRCFGGIAPTCGRIRVLRQAYRCWRYLRWNPDTVLSDVSMSARGIVHWTGRGSRADHQRDARTAHWHCITRAKHSPAAPS